jgi:hypothetical protein
LSYAVEGSEKEESEKPVLRGRAKKFIIIRGGETRRADEELSAATQRAPKRQFADPKEIIASPRNRKKLNFTFL